MYGFNASRSALVLAAFAALCATGVEAQKTKNPIKGVLQSARATTGEILPAPPADQVIVIYKACVYGGTANVTSDSLDLILTNQCIDLTPGFVSNGNVTCGPTSGSPTCMVTAILAKEA